MLMSTGAGSGFGVEAMGAGAGLVSGAATSAGAVSTIAWVEELGAGAAGATDPTLSLSGAIRSASAAVSGAALPSATTQGAEKPANNTRAAAARSHRDDGLSDRLDHTPALFISVHARSL